jgi:hypothetical protein
MNNLYIKARATTVVSNAFTFIVKTDNLSTGSSTSKQFKLPLNSTFNGVTANVDWGDGTTSIITSNVQAEVTHTYLLEGTYVIKITGAIRGWQFNNSGDILKLLSISKYGIFEFNGNTAFYGCSNLNVSANDVPLINTNTLEDTFRNCVSFNGLFSGWNVSGVLTLQGFLRSCNSFRQSLASLNVKNATNIVFFMRTSTGMSTVNYDATLISWANQIPLSYDGNLDFGGSMYTLGGAAAAARSALITDVGSITDGGGI